MGRRRAVRRGALRLRVQPSDLARVWTDAGDAVRAVVESVKVLEKSGLFKAGAGSEPQSDRVIRCDASVMSSDWNAGAVIGVSDYICTIQGAHYVHRKIGHTTIAGSLAEGVFSVEDAIRSMRNTTSKIPFSQCLSHYLDKGGEMFGKRNKGKLTGTVGAVAKDGSGLLSAATSTGGYPEALPGRTGDSGAIGIGTYATPRCAVSCTGDGDQILKAAPGAALDAYLDAEIEQEKALKLAITRMKIVGAVGGFVVMFPNGDTRVCINSSVNIKTYPSIEAIRV